MADVGRPSELKDDQFLLKIRELVLNGDTEEIMQQKLDIPKGTWDYWKWKNYESFQDKLLSYRHERMLRKAELNIEVLQESEDERVNLQANTFVLETLGKKDYSKKTETDITSGGKPIIQIASEIVEKNNLDINRESNTSPEGNS
jgi:hypothetical protein